MKEQKRTTLSYFSWLSLEAKKITSSCFFERNCIKHMERATLWELVILITPWKVYRHKTNGKSCGFIFPYQIYPNRARLVMHNAHGATDTFRKETTMIITVIEIITVSIISWSWEALKNFLFYFHVLFFPYMEAPFFHGFH